MNVLKLDKKTRDALGDDMFAFPRTRSCPLNDARHTSLAWAQVEGVKDATTEERIEARHRIMARATELKVDTTDWHRVKAMNLECMSLSIAQGDHPNKMPFSGVLTKLDEPSDFAPGGSGGRRIIVTAEAARAALPSLLGMAVNFTPSFDGHDTRNKIGIITSAEVVGNELRVAGFVYASDFPETADLIKQLKDVLGFSFEAQRLIVQDPSAEILRITELTFTGAAILLKDKAAYNSTSLAANAAGDLKMTKEELEAILAAAMKPLIDRLTTVEAQSKLVSDSVKAAAEIRAKVEPHAVALEASATAMEAVGIKADHLRKMAADIRAEAAAGRMPTNLSAPATTVVPAVAAGGDDAVKKLIADALKPVQDQLDAEKTKTKDLENKIKAGGIGPERKTLPPGITALLSRIDLKVPDGDEKITAGALDKALSTANLSIPQRIALKTELGRMGKLEVQ